MFHVFQILMPWAEASREAFRLVRSFIHKLVEDAPALPPSDWQLAERS
jgi:hypothetical protein